MFVSAIISFASFILIISHLKPSWLRVVVGYKMITDLVLHGTILYMFFGTSTEGLMQAECAGIMFSLFLRMYRYLFGYSRFVLKPWLHLQRYTGLLNRDEAAKDYQAT